MKHSDDLYLFSAFDEEDQIRSVTRRPEAYVQVVSQGIAAWTFRDPVQPLFELVDVRRGALWIVLGDEVADLKQIAPRCGQNHQTMHDQAFAA